VTILIPSLSCRSCRPNAPFAELARLSRRTLTEIALRALRPFTRGDLDPATLQAVIVEALNFPIPLVEVI